MHNLDAALLLIRIVFGISLVCHGLNKTKNGLAGTAMWFDSIGMRWPRFQATTAATVEILAGLFLVLGLATPLACAAIIGLMTVAIVTVHWRVWFFIFLPNGGWEYCASIATVAASMALSGPGGISLDDSLGFNASIAIGVSGICLGIAGAIAHLAVCYRPKTTPHE